MSMEIMRYVLDDVCMLMCKWTVILGMCKVLLKMQLCLVATDNMLLWVKSSRYLGFTGLKSRL
jgi:hypothetical protein